MGQLSLPLSVSLVTTGSSSVLSAFLPAGLQGRRSLQSPKPCQTSVDTRSGCEADASTPRPPQLLEAQTHLHERTYFIQAGAGGLGVGGEEEALPFSPK